MLRPAVLCALLAALALPALPPRARAGDALPAGVGLTDPVLAYGLSGVSDHATEMPFLDIMHSARPWKARGWSYGKLKKGGYLDPNGWPVRIPEGGRGFFTTWAWGESNAAAPTAAASRAGTYVLTYQGEGTIRLLQSAKVISAQPGRIVFRNASGGSMGLLITATDPDHTGAYIRDIAIVNRKYEGLYRAGEIFNPDFLKVVEDARVLRFMPWMSLGSTAADWAGRPTPATASWMKQGVPVEVMVQLANQTGTEPWFTMPAKASDAYIRAFATYVRDHLDPRLVAHVEYANETWNWAFPDTKWLARQARADWGEKGGPAWINYAAKRATETALIWDKVFGGAAAARVDNVLAVQTGNAWLAGQELTASLWQKHEPGSYVAPASVFDSLAVTSYFGSAMVRKPGPRARLLEEIRSQPVAAARAWLTAQLSDPKVTQSIPRIERQWARMKALAQRHGLKLVAYEGGQHVQQAFAVRGLKKADLKLLTGFLTDYVRSPEMAGLYQQLWDGWAKVGDGPFMQFTDISAPSKFGSWGMYAALGDTNPRAELLTRLNRTSKSWFGGGGGVQYQQGVIRIAGNGGETLRGTGKQDFLVGGSGDDTFEPGTGRDGINGGAGVDTLVLAGKAAAYRLVREGAGFRLTGPGVSDYVTGVEHFRFDDGMLPLETLLAAR